MLAKVEGIKVYNKHAQVCFRDERPGALPYNVAVAFPVHWEGDIRQNLEMDELRARLAEMAYVHVSWSKKLCCYVVRL